jgi:excisionase family DNA binding protein
MNPTRVIESPYMTSREVMAYLRLTSPSGLYHLLNQHGLPHVRRGGRMLFDRRDVDAWLRGTSALELMRQKKGA